MSDATRWMVGLLFMAIPTIAFGGYFLLSILRRNAGTEGITDVQRTYFRAGHAHAGVLVILALVGQFALDYARLSEFVVWALRIGLVIAPLLISGGFFGGAPRTPEGKPTSLILLVPIGAVVLGVTTVGVGVGLLVSG